MSNTFSNIKIKPTHNEEDISNIFKGNKPVVPFSSNTSRRNIKISQTLN